MIAIGFEKKKSVVAAVGGLLLLICGLLLLGLSPTSGIEKDYGTFVRYIGDSNYNVDVNVGYLNSSNDYSLFVLSNIFLYGGFVVMLASFLIALAVHRGGKREI